MLARARTLAAARGRRRPGALCAPRVEHVVDARAARAVSERPAAARAGRDLRAGDLGHRQAAARRRQADRQRPRLAAVGRRRARHARPTRRRRRARWCAAQRDDADRAPQRRRAAVHRGRRAAQPRDSRTARLRRAAPHDQTERTAISSTRASGAARPTRSCARCTSAQTTASTPAAPPPASSKHTTSSPTRTAARPSSPT